MATMRSSRAPARLSAAPTAMMIIISVCINSCLAGVINDNPIGARADAAAQYNSSGGGEYYSNYNSYRYVESADGMSEMDLLRRFSADEIAAARLLLTKLNKPALHSIQSPDGDVIDCVLREKQPVFDHPTMKNHIIRDFPSSSLKHIDPTTPNLALGSQLWHQVGTCPKGTIPIRRITLVDALRIKHYSTSSSHVGLDGFNHEYAEAFYNVNEGIHGASASFSLWSPYVQGESEMSASKLWILGGQFTGTQMETIETGWMVNPQLYGDAQPRFFSFWTNDYTKIQCYDLHCSPGFVQTSYVVALGTTINPISMYHGNQYEIGLSIWKDPTTNDWWLRYFTEVVGYWPAPLFNYLSDSGNIVHWGGVVVNAEIENGQHTTTQMGSGHFSKEGYKGAAYIKDLQVTNSNHEITDVSRGDLTIYASNSACYDAQLLQYKKWKTSLFFGGPGRNPQCS